jgi:hypothetical protein
LLREMFAAHYTGTVKKIPSICIQVNTANNLRLNGFPSRYFSRRYMQCSRSDLIWL